MATETTYEKRGLLDGVGNMYTQWLTNEGSPTIAPTYDDKVYETPSIQKVEVSLTVNDKEVYLSNKLHDKKERVTKAEITLDAGYFTAGFAEEAQGMVKVGEGAWIMPENPKKKPFRLSFPITDNNDDEVIMIFPKCTLGVSNKSASTRTEEAQEQIPSYTITSTPLLYKKTAEDTNGVYMLVDLTTEEAKAAWDRVKLLTETIYDQTTLATAKKGASAGEGSEG